MGRKKKNTEYLRMIIYFLIKLGKNSDEICSALNINKYKLYRARVNPPESNRQNKIPISEEQYFSNWNYHDYDTKQEIFDVCTFLYYRGHIPINDIAELFFDKKGYSRATLYRQVLDPEKRYERKSKWYEPCSYIKRHYEKKPTSQKKKCEYQESCSRDCCPFYMERYI